MVETDKEIINFYMGVIKRILDGGKLENMQWLHAEMEVRPADLPDESIEVSARLSLDLPSEDYEVEVGPVRRVPKKRVLKYVRLHEFEFVEEVDLSKAKVDIFYTPKPVTK
jgi:hypothetical protein